MALMNIYDGKEDQESGKAFFSADVEIIDGIVGKYTCGDCDGAGFLGCQWPDGYRQSKCISCKSAGYQFVGL